MRYIKTTQIEEIISKLPDAREYPNNRIEVALAPKLETMITEMPPMSESIKIDKLYFTNIKDEWHLDFNDL